MRLARYTIPLGIALLCIGVVLLVNAKPNDGSNPSNGGIDFSQPKHPVTEDMIKRADEMARVEAPAYSRTDVKSNPATVAGKNLPRPQLVLFILDGCPCSIDAQPIFNDFSKTWAGKVDFIGVINDDEKKGREWVSDFRPAFPVVPDPTKEIIKAYKARQSVYSALVSKDGKIVKMWPGYSIDMLNEMNQAIAKEVGSDVPKFDTKYAPKERTSGCYF